MEERHRAGARHRDADQARAEQLQIALGRLLVLLGVFEVGVEAVEFLFLLGPGIDQHEHAVVLDLRQLERLVRLGQLGSETNLQRREVDFLNGRQHRADFEEQLPPDHYEKEVSASVCVKAQEESDFMEAALQDIAMHNVDEVSPVFNLAY